MHEKSDQRKLLFLLRKKRTRGENLQRMAGKAPKLKK
jgi:hypothetical protein